MDWGREEYGPMCVMAVQSWPAMHVLISSHEIPELFEYFQLLISFQNLIIDISPAEMDGEWEKVSTYHF